MLLFGHVELGRNYPANPLPFRQDSSMLFFTGCTLPGAAALIEPDGSTTLYLPSRPADDKIWHGPAPSPEQIGRWSEVDAVAPRSELAARVSQLRAAGADVVSVPVAQASVQAEQTQLLGGLGPAEPANAALEATISARLRRDAAEIAAMREAAMVTEHAMRLAMGATRAGVTERALEALIRGVFTANGADAAYPPIVTTRGEILHGHATSNVLTQGSLLLVDAGAEHPTGVATDVTRTWPVSGRFEGRQGPVYEAVLAAQRAAIDVCRPGLRYRDVHLAAMRVLTGAAIEWGLLRGEVDGLVERGAVAAFFPHGVGHLIGLDVHDMELFGDRAGYAAGRHRSDRVGLRYLRLDRDLEPGMAVTIEPGFYLSRALLQDASLRDTLGDSVCWAEAERWLPFGGIRLEDDVLITESDPIVLTAGIPISASDVEAAIGRGPDLAATMLLPTR